MVGRGCSGVLLVLVMTGCGDKAEPEFTRCGNLQTAGNLPAAQDACKKAVAADSTSTAGKAASAKLADINATLKKREEEAAKEGANKAAAAAKQAERDARCDRWTAFCPQLGPNGSVERFKSKVACESSTNDLRTTMGVDCNPCRNGCED